MFLIYFLLRFLILEGWRNHISPDKYVEVLLESLKELKDERVEAFYLQWFKTLKEKIGFTPKVISEATKEIEEEIRSHKKPSNPGRKTWLFFCAESEGDFYFRCYRK